MVDLTNDDVSPKLWRPQIVVAPHPCSAVHGEKDRTAASAGAALDVAPFRNPLHRKACSLSETDHLLAESLRHSLQPRHGFASKSGLIDRSEAFGPFLDVPGDLLPKAGAEPAAQRNADVIR